MIVAMSVKINRQQEADNADEREPSPRRYIKVNELRTIGSGKHGQSVPFDCLGQTDSRKSRYRLTQAAGGPGSKLPY